MNCGRTHLNAPARWTQSPRRPRHGQSLVEFAIVSLVVYMLLAAILTFGHMLFVAQGAQQVADVAAREISRTPLPADSHTLEQILRGDANSDPVVAGVRQRIYDEHYLVLNLDTLHGFATLQDLTAALPLVNQQLVPLMISDQIGGTRVLRYPGAVFNDSNTADDPAAPAPSGFLVSIPLVTSRDSEGVETIRWVPVVEEIEPADTTDDRHDPFRLSSELRGVVALRINYPFQSASMSSFQTRPPGFDGMGSANLADDASVTQTPGPFAPTGSLVASDRVASPYAGTLGLGRQEAFGKPVRPFRRVISAQAIYRREIFSEPEP